MDANRALRWAVYYVALAAVATLLGGALVGAGVVVSFGPATDQFADGAALSSVLSTAAPGLALALVGLVLWAVGCVAAFVKVFTAAVDEQMRERFDSEKVKSEILSVLDDRLTDVERDVTEVRRKFDEMKREEVAEEFEFGQQD